VGRKRALSFSIYTAMREPRKKKKATLTDVSSPRGGCPSRVAEKSSSDEVQPGGDPLPAPEKCTSKVVKQKKGCFRARKEKG